MIHRQTSAHEQREGKREGSVEVGHISVFQPPALLAVDNGRAPYYRRATRRLMLGWEVATLAVHRVSGSEPVSLRTHRHRDRSRPLKSAVVEYQAPSVAV